MDATSVTQDATSVTQFQARKAGATLFATAAAIITMNLDTTGMDWTGRAGAPLLWQWSR